MRQSVSVWGSGYAFPISICPNGLGKLVRREMLLKESSVCLARIDFKFLKYLMAKWEEEVSGFSDYVIK